MNRRTMIASGAALMAVPAVLETSHNIALGWIRGGKIAGSPETPDEWDWEVRKGAAKPAGNGWQPITRQADLDSLAGTQT